MGEACLTEPPTLSCTGLCLGRASWGSIMGNGVRTCFVPDLSWDMGSRSNVMGQILRKIPRYEEDIAKIWGKYKGVHVAREHCTSIFRGYAGRGKRGGRSRGQISRA